MKKVLLLTAALFLTQWNTADASDIRILSDEGNWIAYGGLNEVKTPMCGMKTAWNVNNVKAWVAFKWFKNGGLDIEIDIGKSNWKIPVGTVAKISIQFDDMEPWTGNAARNNDNTPNEIWIRLTSDKWNKFFNEVRLSSRIRVSFPSGSESDWTGYMRGSNSAVTALTNCTQFYSPSAPPTLPKEVPPPPATQPYDSESTVSNRT